MCPTAFTVDYECDQPLKAMLYSDFTTVKRLLASFI